jgi:hypothetical protein
MKSLLWSVGSVLLATLAGGLVIAGIGATGRAVLRADTAGEVPAALFGLVVIAWGVGAAVGVHVVARFQPQRALAHGIAVLCLFIALAAVNLVSLQHPVWVVPAAVVAFALGGMIGLRSASSASAALRAG